VQVVLSASKGCTVSKLTMHTSPPASQTALWQQCKAVPEIVDGAPCRCSGLRDMHANTREPCALPLPVPEIGDSATLKVHYGSLKIENGQTLSPDELLDVSIWLVSA